MRRWLPKSLRAQLLLGILLPVAAFIAMTAIGLVAAILVFPLDGSPAHSVARLPDGLIKTISVEHPTGEFSVRLVLEKEEAGLRVVSAGLLRTARKLFDGRIFPRWDVAAKLK